MFPHATIGPGRRFLGIYIPIDMHDTLRVLAAAQGVTLAEVGRRLLTEALLRPERTRGRAVPRGVRTPR